MLRGEGDDYPFDLQTYRYMTYDRKDPAASLGELVRALRSTLDSAEQDSPVFRSLPALREQERSHFLPVPVEFREEVERAQADKQHGDLALLALETRGFQWGVEGLRVVGRAQFKLRDFEGAGASWEEVRDAYPDDKEANTWLGTIYQRLGKLKLSDQRLNRVLDNAETTPKERAEAYTLQGRNAKTQWIEDWKGDAQSPRPANEWRQSALRSPFLRKSYELCEKGFGEDLNHFYSGLSALAMLTVLVELASEMGDVWAESFEDEEEAVTSLARLKKQRDALAPSVARSINAARERLKRESDAARDAARRDELLDELRWATISEADHCCLTSKVSNMVKSKYRDSLADVAEFYSDSAGKQLVLYRELGVLKSNVEAGLEIAKPTEEQGREQTQPHVIVFTGHRIDDEDRVSKGKPKRFPKEMEPTAREAIRAAIVGELGEANTKAVGVAGGASGGDILFHEVCAELGIPTRLYLALPRADYVRESVQGAGHDWVRRFNKLYETLERRELADSEDLPRWLREKVGGYTVWQRNNLWVLSNAIALDKKGGGTNLTLIALWNGKQGDGAGGTEDMVEQASKRGARTIILPTEQLFGLAG
jgi:tetratricopeptide (TPR) repeat protein